MNERKFVDFYFKLNEPIGLEGPKLIKNWIQQIKDHRSLPAEEEKNIEK